MAADLGAASMLGQRVNGLALAPGPVRNRDRLFGPGGLAFDQLFQLTDTRDKKVVREFMPMPIETDLPAPYYSWWWDNTRNYKAILKPAPSRDAVLDAFYARTKQVRRVI